MGKPAGPWLADNAVVSAAFLRAFPARLALVYVVAVVMCVWTWGTWPDVIVDFGRELYLAWRVHAGERLYVDVASFNGPLSPYVNALWFRLFGLGLHSVVRGNLLLLAAFIPLLLWVLEQSGDWWSATVGALVFVAVFAFGEYDDIGNFNYVTPYSHELVHGLILSMAALAALGWYGRSGRQAGLPLAGVCLGAVFITKPEMFLAAGVSVGCGALLLVRHHERHGRRAITLVLSAVAAFLIAPLLAWSLLALKMGPLPALAGLLSPYAHVLDPGVSGLTFYRRLTGLDDPRGALLAIGKAAAILAVLVVSMTGAAIAARRSRYRDEIVAACGIAVFAAGIAGYSWVMTAVARPWPLVVLAAALVALRQFVMPGGLDRPRLVAQATFILFAGLLTLKFALNARVYRYGFVLAMPACMVLILIAQSWIPDWLERRGGDGRVFRALSLVAIATASMVFLIAHRERLMVTVHPIGGPVDVFSGNSRVVPASEMLREIEHRLKPDDRLVVLPEGAMLNFLSRRPSTVPYVNFLPPELVMFGEPPMVAALVAQPPEFVVLVDRPMAEYGLRGFGVDYGQAIGSWVMANYVAVASVEAAPSSDRRFGMQLLRRRTP